MVTGTCTEKWVDGRVLRARVAQKMFTEKSLTNLLEHINGCPWENRIKLKSSQSSRPTNGSAIVLVVLQKEKNAANFTSGWLDTEAAWHGEGV